LSELFAALRRPTSEALDGLPVPVGFCDERGRTLFVNRALAEHLGLERSDWLGRPLHAWLGPEHAARTRSAFARGAASAPSIHLLALARRGRAGKVEVLFVAGPLRGRHGGILGFVFALLPRRAAARAITQHLEASLAAAQEIVRSVAGQRVRPSEAEPASLDELRESVPALRRLSARELEVTRRLAEGARTRDVARALDITSNTVRNHLKAVFRKLGVHDQAELIGRIRAWSENGGTR
jgi:PAS domain S-box-containing protein